MRRAETVLGAGPRAYLLGWAMRLRFEHLASRHSHEHNRTAVEHAHVAHVDFDGELAGEAHVHDHDQPAAPDPPVAATAAG